MTNCGLTTYYLQNIKLTIMNRQQAKEIFNNLSSYVRNTSLMEAYARGADIESLNRATKKWIDDPWPTFDRHPSEYRVKPNSLKYYFDGMWWLISCNSEDGIKFTNISSLSTEDMNKVQMVCRYFPIKGIQHYECGEWVKVMQPNAEDIAKNLGDYRITPSEKSSVCDKCAFSVEGDHCGLFGYTNEYPKMKSCKAFNTEAPNGFKLRDGYFSWK